MENFTGPDTWTDRLVKSLVVMENFTGPDTWTDPLVKI